MARVIFSWLFIILLYFFFNNSLLSQLQEPVLIAPGSDNTFWLAHLLHIPQLLSKHWPALIFDMLLTTSCLICIILPMSRSVTWITVTGVWILFICYSSAAGKPYAQIGYLLAPLPFLAFKENRFDLLWNLFRYWVCLLYFSGGLYKLYYGGFFYGDNMSQIIWQANADWFVFHNTGTSFEIKNYFIQHPGFAQRFYRLATVTDLLMIAGLFTKRFDRWLLVALIAFHVANFMLLGISFAEQSLIFAAFLPWPAWGRYYNSIKSDD